MIRRCEDSSGHNYHLYGGRGITVCERWRNSFAAFLADMGRPPSSAHSLDRVDNDGNYEPGNCRWATMPEQMRNARTTRMIEFDGRIQCLKDWAKETGVPSASICRRLGLGWPIRRALTTPNRIRRDHRRKMAA